MIVSLVDLEAVAVRDEHGTAFPTLKRRTPMSAYAFLKAPCCLNVSSVPPKITTNMYQP